MRSSEIPEGVFWVRLINTSIADDGAIVRATRWDGDVVLFFGPGVTNPGFRTDAESARRARLRALGYDTTAPINTYRTNMRLEWLLAEQPADAQPMTMLPWFTDPAISSAAEPDFWWVALSGSLAVQMRTVGPLMMLREPEPNFSNVLIGNEETLPGGHTPGSSVGGMHQMIAEHGVVGSPRYFGCRDSYAGDWTRVDAPDSVPVPTRPEDLKVGDWFTWGGQVSWHRVSLRDGERVYVDMRSYRNVEPRSENWNASYVSDNFLADPAQYPATLTEWITNQEPVAAPQITEPAEPVSTHAADIATIGRILIAEAESRSWCGEYDQIVRRINREISIPLPVRNAEYTITYTVPSPQQGTVRQRFTAPPTQAQAQAYLPAGAVFVSVESTPEF